MKKCAVIYNPNSSGFKEKNLKAAIKEIQNTNLIPFPIESTHKNFLIENMQTLNEQFDYILTMGGDGTVSKAYEGFNQLTTEQKALYGHIPTGTTNDMGPNTNLPRYNPAFATFLLLHGNIEQRDIITLNNHAIAYVGTAGILAPITYLIDQEEKTKEAGTISYLTYGASRLMQDPKIYKDIVNNPYNVTYEIDGKQTTTDIIFIAIFNAKSFAHLTINPHANMTDGTFYIALIHNQKDLRKLFLSTILYESSCMGVKDLTMTTDNFTLTFNNRIPEYPMCCDGEGIDILNNKKTLEVKTTKKVKQLVGKSFKPKYY